MAPPTIYAVGTSPVNISTFVSPRSSHHSSSGSSESTHESPTFPLKSVSDGLGPYIHSRQKTARIRAGLSAYLASHLVLEGETHSLNQPSNGNSNSNAQHTRGGIHTQPFQSSAVSSYSFEPHNSGVGSSSAFSHAILACPPANMSIDNASAAAIPENVLPPDSLRARYLKAISVHAQARKKAISVKNEVRDLTMTWERERRFGQENGGGNGNGNGTNSGGGTTGNGGNTGVAGGSGMMGSSTTVVGTSTDSGNGGSRSANGVAANGGGSATDSSIESATRDYLELLSRRKQAKQWEAILESLKCVDEVSEKVDIRSGLQPWIRSHLEGRGMKSPGRHFLPDNEQTNDGAFDGQNERGDDSRKRTVPLQEWVYRIQKEYILAQKDYSTAQDEVHKAKVAATEAKAAATSRQNGRVDAETEELKRQVYALNRAREYMVSWIDGELSRLGEGDGGDVDDVDDVTMPIDPKVTRDGALDVSSAMGEIEAAYGRYINARKDMVERSSLLLVGESAISSLLPGTYRSTVTTSGAGSNGANSSASVLSPSGSSLPSSSFLEQQQRPLALSQLILPFLPALLTCSRTDRYLLQQSAQLRRQNGAITKRTGETMERVLDSSFLLSKAAEVDVKRVLAQERGGDGEDGGILTELIGDENGENGRADVDEVQRRLKALRRRIREHHDTLHLPSVAAANISNAGSSSLSHPSFPPPRHNNLHQQHHRQHASQSFSDAVAGIPASSSQFEIDDIGTTTSSSVTGISAWTEAAAKLRIQADAHVSEKTKEAGRALDRALVAIEEARVRERVWEKVGLEC